MIELTDNNIQNMTITELLSNDTLDSLIDEEYNTFDPSEFDAEDDDAQWYDDDDDEDSTEDLESQGYSIEDEDDDFFDEDEEDQYQDESDEIFDIDF